MGSFYLDHCIYLPPMLGWFFFSALISSYNKYVFGNAHLAFPCPLLMTSVHFLVQWVVSYTLSTINPEFWGGDQVRDMSWRTFLAISIPCGVVTSGDVGLSNLALVRISLTFYTMVKASAPIFVVASAYLFGIERITCTLIIVVLVISAGEFLTVWGETEFDLVGFLLCLGASVVTGMRWTVIQLKLQSLQPPLKSTMATMRILSPSMFVTMLVVSIGVEKPWAKLGPDSGTTYFATPRNTFITLAMAFAGAFLAIAMVSCEFVLIMKSNAFVLMIGGVIKEMITITVGISVFGDVINGINLAGFLVVFSGVVMYKVVHFMAKMEAEAAGLVDDDMGDIRGGRAVSYAHLEGTSAPKGDDSGAEDGVFTIGDDDDEFVEERLSISNRLDDPSGLGGKSAENGQEARGIEAAPLEISSTSSGETRPSRLADLLGSRGAKSGKGGDEAREFLEPSSKIV